MPVHLSLGSTAPFNRPSASVENNCILSCCLTITTASLSDPVQNTTPEGVLSSCWCSLTLTHTLPQWVHRRVRVPRDLDSTLYHCLVFVKFLSVSDPTMILMIELLESFISAYEYSVPCSSLWSAKKPSVLQSETIHFDIQLKADSPSETHLLLSFKQSAWICCIDCIPNPLVSVIELVCSSGNIAKLSS